MMGHVGLVGHLGVVVGVLRVLLRLVTKMIVQGGLSESLPLSWSPLGLSPLGYLLFSAKRQDKCRPLSSGLVGRMLHSGKPSSGPLWTDADGP